MNHNIPSTKTQATWLNVPLILLLLLGFALGCTGSKARGEMSNILCQPTTRLVNGELDYGFNAIVTVKNVGETGYLSIAAELSTSEGEWQRNQKLIFDAGETQTLTYFFDEPTINTGSPQCRVGVTPRAN